ncbi:MAG: TonB-dependent receptor [Proteobacteria bacterium]|nr:TonB-dependent receptor [Pseudomonadota bacterium]
MSRWDNVFLVAVVVAEVLAIPAVFASTQMPNDAGPASVAAKGDASEQGSGQSGANGTKQDGEKPPEQPAAMEAITVTGIRESLNSAISIKQLADSVVDAINAEDVGKFPDVNVAESVQRISGVQVNRSRGEAQTVNIRGLPAIFTLSTFNGGTLPNALSNADQVSTRAFDFTILPSEFIRTLEVYKSPTADLEEGGLAGVVNVKTPHAFDIHKPVFVVSAQGENESNSGKTSPRVSGLYSNIFAEGRLGLTLGAAYSKRSPETHAFEGDYVSATEASGIPPGGGPDDLNGNGVIEPSQRVRIPSTVFYNMYTESRERGSAIGSLEYKASDSLKLYMDGFYSRLDVDAVRHENISFFSNSASVVSSGIKVQTLEGLQTATQFQVNGLDLRGGGRYEDRHGDIQSLTGGLKFEPYGWLTTLEGNYSKSTQKRSNLNLATIANGYGLYDASNGSDLASVTYLNGFDQSRLDPNSFRIASLNGEFLRHSKDELYSVKFDARHDLSDEGLTSFRFGARYSDRSQNQDNNRLVVSAAALSKLLGGLPAGPIAGSVSAAPFMQLIRPGNGAFLDSYDGSAMFPTQWLGADTRGLLGKLSDGQLIGAGSFTNDPTGIVDVKEKTLAGYFRADFGWGSFSGNAGVRVVKTWQDTAGVSPDLSKITLEPEAGNITTIPSAQPIGVSRAYTDFLPSLNLKYDVAEDFVLRASASRTMARPNLTNISPSTVASGVNLTISRNNPYLDPFRSNNFDLAAEWYFQPGGLAGASAFYKDLESLIRTETTVQSFPITVIRSNGTSSTTNIDFSVSRLINGSGVRVKGLEVYYQQAFTGLPAPFDGLGTLLNYTYIDNSDPTQLTAASRNNFNATAYYEKGPIGVRLSYAWRGGFLLTPQQSFNMGVKTMPYGTLDGSLSYKINDRFSLVLEGQNLLDRAEVQRYTTGLPFAYIDAGRRVLLGGRFALE